jgi:hypothetical protein
VGWAAAHRNVSRARKNYVYSRYGITTRKPYGQPGSYEIDHLIPLELGGNNAITNLWPEAYPGYGNKDQLENRFHQLMCENPPKVGLKVAQTFMMRHYTK